MRKRIFIVMAAVLLVAVLAGCLAACDKGGGVDLTEYNAIVDRLNAAGYSVTASAGIDAAMSSTGTGIFADFDGMSADWSISAFKTNDTMDMVMIVKFTTQEDVSKYKAAIVKMYNSMAGAGGVTFDTYEELEAYCKENDAPLGLEFRDTMLVSAYGSGAADAFGE